jgi:hypothetical protein
MFGVFCLRLAFGLLVFLLPLWSSPVNPRFYRAHFLTALGLSVAAFFLLQGAIDVVLGCVLVFGMLACAVGSMAWSLEGAPGGRISLVSGVLCGGFALVLLARHENTPSVPLAHLLASHFTSAAVLGSATTAMLLGHSYLIAPTMSIKPLQRLLLALGASLLLAFVVAVLQLWSWTEAGWSHNLETEAVLWLIVRWGVGLIAPLVLGWMAWETTRIRSTQSATGILYVVVICCFLGELTSQLLFDYMRPGPLPTER